MTTKHKKKPPADEQVDDDDKGTDDDEHDDDTGGGDDDGHIEAVVRRVLEDVLGGGEGDDDKSGGGDGKGESGAPRSAADMERTMYEATRRAMAKLRNEERSEGRIKELEAKVERVVTEQAPAAVRRVTKIMWGGGDTR